MNDFPPGKDTDIFSAFAPHESLVAPASCILSETN
jgi:hypothetical protein